MIFFWDNEVHMKDNVSFEIRKTRLDIVLKLFYAFIAVAGSILVIFAKPENQKIVDNTVMFLGLETLLFILLFVMAIYIFCEIRCFQKKDEDTELNINKANYAYKRIIRCFAISGVCVVINILSFVFSQMENSFISWIEPTETSMQISFWTMIACSLIPKDLYWKIISLEHDDDSDKQKYILKIGNFPIIKEFAIHGFALKNLGIVFATRFVFDLLYLHWFK